MTTLSPENSISARRSASFILKPVLMKNCSTLPGKVKRKPPIDKTEWDGFFDENGHLAKSRDFICVNILERGLHPLVRTEAWKFLTGYYSWQSSQDERLTVDSTRRKNYEALCQMYEKIQPLLENLHRNFIETRNNIAYDIQKLYDKDPLGNILIDKKKLEKILLLSYVCNTQAEYQQGFHEMVMLFQLMVEHDHETFWLFQFFLQKTEHSCVINIGVGKNLDMLNNLINFLDPMFAEHLSAADGEALQELPGAGGLQPAADGARAGAAGEHDWRRHPPEAFPDCPSPAHGRHFRLQRRSLCHFLCHQLMALRGLPTVCVCNSYLPEQTVRPEDTALTPHYQWL
nr:TBC1 domain family member 21 isoform X9 [Equus asinus]